MQRLHRCGCPVEGSAKWDGIDGRQGVGQVQDPRQAEGARHYTLYPIQTEPQQESPVQQEGLVHNGP